MKRKSLIFAVLVLLAGILPLHAQRTVLLSNVRRIYIEKMADNLDQYLASAISKKMKGSVTVVLNRSEADAIMRGVNIGAQTTAEATVQLVDPSEKEVIWSGTGSDRKVLTLGIQHGGQDKIADRLIGELKKAMTH
jgi:hypothetical protein